MLMEKNGRFSPSVEEKSDPGDRKPDEKGKHFTSELDDKPQAGNGESVTGDSRVAVDPGDPEQEHLDNLALATGGLFLPNDFEPSAADVICSKGSVSYHHAGNVRLRELVENSLEAYQRADTKVDRTNMVSRILAKVEGKFVRREPFTKRWYVLDTRTRREKVGQAIRFALRKVHKYMPKGSAKRLQQRSQQRQQDKLQQDRKQEESPKTDLTPSSSRTGTSAIANHQVDNDAANPRNPRIQLGRTFPAGIAGVPRMAVVPHSLLAQNGATSLRGMPSIVTLGSYSDVHQAAADARARGLNENPWTSTLTAASLGGLPLHAPIHVHPAASTLTLFPSHLTTLGTTRLPTIYPSSLYATGEGQAGLPQSRLPQRDLMFPQQHQERFTAADISECRYQWGNGETIRRRTPLQLGVPNTSVLLELPGQRTSHKRENDPSHGSAGNSAANASVPRNEIHFSGFPSRTGYSTAAFSPTTAASFVRLPSQEATYAIAPNVYQVASQQGSFYVSQDVVGRSTSSTRSENSSSLATEKAQQQLKDGVGLVRVDRKRAT